MYLKCKNNSVTLFGTVEYAKVFTVTSSSDLLLVGQRLKDGKDD